MAASQPAFPPGVFLARPIISRLPRLFSRRPAAPRKSLGCVPYPRWLRLSSIWLLHIVFDLWISRDPARNS